MGLWSADLGGRTVFRGKCRSETLAAAPRPCPCQRLANPGARIGVPSSQARKCWELLRHPQMIFTVLCPSPIQVKARGQTGTSVPKHVEMSFSGHHGVPSSGAQPRECLGMRPDSCRTGFRGLGQGLGGSGQIEPRSAAQPDPGIVVRQDARSSGWDSPGYPLSRSSAA